MDNIPIPSDIPLPLPGDELWLKALLVVVFLAHILFVNLMVGGTLITLACEIVGRRRREFDALAREISRTITVNKSLAVVIGVAPLLLLNVLYTVHFYSANALTGYAWVSVIPLVSIAFLIAYLHKYSWEHFAQRKGLHIAIGAVAALLFLFVPFIFLANINLMLFPTKWTEVRGFFSAVLLENVLPRYGHFLLASIAITGLFLFAWFTRSGYPLEAKLPGLERARLRRIFYFVVFGATFGQLFMGPLVYFTLPEIGINWHLIGVIGVGVFFALCALFLLWRETLASPARIGKRYVTIATLLTWTVCCMAYGRHVYRDNALADHKAMMAVRTQNASIAADAAGIRAAAGIGARDWAPGEEIFTKTCSSCHAFDSVLVGPPITEIATLYADNPAGIVTWTLNPGKKRAGFSQMPAFRLPEDKLTEVAQYMLDLAAASKKD